MFPIVLKNVSKRFEDKIVLENVDFNFKAKTKYILTGESGVGKTTLLNMLAGYISPDNGQIIVNKDINIEYLFQDECLFSNLTVEENLYIKACCLNMDNSLFKSIATNILKKFNIEKIKDRKIEMLSGGEKQRVQLASILLSSPDVILLDEPTSKLDEENKKNIENIINEEFKDKLLIIVCHDKDIKYNDSIILKIYQGGIHI